MIIVEFHEKEQGMVITFFGHRSLVGMEQIKKRVKNALEGYETEGKETVFYCGGQGDFDALCAEVCREWTKTHRDSLLYLITPYITETAQSRNEELMKAGAYDGILYPPLEKVPYRYAIVKRNEWMVREADVIIAYVKQSYGGAYKALSYAQKMGKRVVNVAL